MTFPLITTALSAVVLSLAWLIYGWKQGRKDNIRGLPLPPGPKGYPIIGNLLDLPPDKPWVTFHEWSKIYGVFTREKILENI